MNLDLLLTGCGLALTDVAVCLHKPGAVHVRRAIAIMAETASELFACYQSTHSATAEATLKRRPFMASFIARGDGALVFAGLFARQGWGLRTAAELNGDPMQQAVQARTGNWTFDGDDRSVFDLVPHAALHDLIGRLAIADPGGRTYMRLADTTPLPIVEISPVARLVPEMPSWDRLILSADDIAHLPRDWALRLSEWRGIYLIVDDSDGARYVGAAYGMDNLLGRWRAHVAGDVGVTCALSRRRTAGFRFSILQLLAPTLQIAEVTAVEQTCMARLHTRDFGLNA
ncbi:hypothetical protein SAMN04488003_11473 [Loktanella fryxellensis]|uniref:GIY-YIG domain-containing protein n=1 Tax=Loktanella fryxellensis TaxID=245187 RepID=A0A1H8G1V6_9RHOB|nr:hypothetical protein [Loktanella fryxellensis]SEN37869.1 hypothetical protein SAMN04488003_11473 [Loktanella fryxellensis]